MDKLIGGIIDDYTLYRIIGGMIMVLILLAVYLGIQITLTWKFLNKDDVNPDAIIPNERSFYRNTIFIFITGFFMLSHVFFEGSGKFVPDSTTYELFELISLSGLVLFMNEWNNILKRIKKNQKV